MTTRGAASVAVVGALALGLAACREEDPGAAQGEGGGRDLGGEIAVDRSGALAPFAVAAAESFTADNPDVTLRVSQSTSSDGFDRLCAGQVQVLYASRPIAPEERRACSRNGVPVEALRVASQAVAVTTHRSLPIDCLSTTELEELWRRDSEVENYSELDLELPNQRISLHAPGAGSAAFELFTEAFGGEDGQRTDLPPPAGEDQLVQSVAGDKGGLGYFGFPYYDQDRDQLNLVGVDAGDGCVKPSLETIQGGAYEPLSRPILIYSGQEAAGRPEVAALLEHTTRNHVRIARDSQNVPMSEQQARRTLRAVESRG